jgi:hypothetical protein
MFSNIINKNKYTKKKVKTSGIFIIAWERNIIPCTGIFTLLLFLSENLKLHIRGI